jgi:signal peptide peptidase SppA
MKSYERILRAVYATPWFIERSKLDAIVGFLELKAAGSGPSEETLAAVRAASAAAADRSIARQSGAVAVLPLMGLITHRGNMMGDISGPRGTSVEKFTAGFRQALNDPNVKAIVIDVDSPGGSVDGVDELASEIFQARGKKPMTAIANTLMASAAYYIGSAADELVVTPSGLVGSIGVYMAHTDTSEKDAKDGVKTTVISAGKYKAEGAAGKPLGEDGIAYAQSVVDSFYEQFVKAVARGRGVSAAAVRNGFGEGRVVTAKQAVELGMVDRVATFDQVLAKYGASRNPSGATAEADAAIKAEAAANELEAEMAAAPDPDAIARDIEIRRRMIEFAAL